MMKCNYILTNRITFPEQPLPAMGRISLNIIDVLYLLPHWPEHPSHLRDWLCHKSMPGYDGHHTCADAARRLFSDWYQQLAQNSGRM